MEYIILIDWLMREASSSSNEVLIKVILFVLVERAVSQLPHILPDYMLVFAVPVLAHDPAFTTYDSVTQLKVPYNFLKLAWLWT